MITSMHLTSLKIKLKMPTVVSGPLISPKSDLEQEESTISITS
jgi:hypothetical protein